MYSERLDTYSLEHWLLGVTDTVYISDLRSTGCLHFTGVQTFINLHGQTPTEIDYFKFKPEAPFILPDYLPDYPLSYAVMHSLPICRIENNVFVPAYSLFIVSYFSNEPNELHHRSSPAGRCDGPVSRPYTFKKDWDLLPWVEAGKLWWLDLERDDLPLKTGSVADFPYANIEGRRECFVYRNGEFRNILDSY
jgi:hypothetical protein